MNLLKKYRAGPIQIEKFIIDWDDLSDDVLRRLDEVLPQSTVYLNPEYTVLARTDVPVEIFVKQARRAQVLWNKRLSRAMGPTARKKNMERADPATRQLVFTGIMLVNGQSMHPMGWPDAQKPKNTRPDS